MPLPCRAVCARRWKKPRRLSALCLLAREGLLFLKDGQPVRPDPKNLAGYTELAGRRGGYWPSSPEIGSAMVHDDTHDPKP
jgi:hypothetical protein